MSSYVLTPIVSVWPRSLSNEFVARSLMTPCQKEILGSNCSISCVFLTRWNTRSVLVASILSLLGLSLKTFRLNRTTRFIDLRRPHCWILVLKLSAGIRRRAGEWLRFQIDLSGRIEEEPTRWKRRHERCVFHLSTACLLFIKRTINLVDDSARL